jgi:hypothetical protein
LFRSVGAAGTGDRTGDEHIDLSRAGRHSLTVHGLSGAG